MLNSSPAALQKGLGRAAVLFGLSHTTGMLLSFVASSLLVRVAAPAAVASYLLLQQAVIGVSMALEMGFVPATLRFAPLTRGSGGREASALLRRRLLGMQGMIWLLVAPALALAWPYLSVRLDAPELASATGVLIGTATLIAFDHVADAYLRSFRKYRASALLSELFPRGLLSLMFLALLLGGPAFASWTVLCGAFFLTHFVTSLGYAVALWRTTADESSLPRVATLPPTSGTLLTTVGTMGLRSVTAILLNVSGLWLVSWGRTHEEVAVFGMMAALVQIMAVMQSVAGQLLPQEVALLHVDGRIADLEGMLRTSATIIGIVSCLTWFGFLLIGRPLIRIAFGDAYVAGWNILMILAVGRAFDGIAGFSGYLLQMTGHHVTLLWITVAAAAVHLLGGLALAKPLGGIGIAISSTLALLTLNVLMAAAARKHLGVLSLAYFRPAQWVEIARSVRFDKGRFRSLLDE